MRRNRNISLPMSVIWSLAPTLLALGLGMGLWISYVDKDAYERGSNEVLLRLIEDAKKCAPVDIHVGTATTTIYSIDCYKPSGQKVKEVTPEDVEQAFKNRR
jgi:hypothetical protein